MKFHLRNAVKPIEPELHYILKLWGINAGASVQFSGEDQDAIAIGTDTADRIQVSSSFATGHFLNATFNDKGKIVNPDTGHPDLLFTAFYLVNALQEHNDQDKDELGRFRYRNSLQFRLKNIQVNTVQHCFDKISELAGVTPKTFASRFFLSHDIDIVHGAIFEDGLNVLKKGRVDQFMKLLFNVALQKPDWLNMDKIMKMESEYDCKSVFYWIVNKGRINQREVNADYNFHSGPIQRNYKLVAQHGFENGLHKSISAETFQEELQKFGTTPDGNRYHYLKFSLPQAYHDLEQSGLKLDASLGFAEEIGFRNNYGLPFTPYNLRDRKPFTFVEVPLHVMDRTFFQYQKLSPKEAEKKIIAFFEKNKTNSVISILWHNNFFSEYKFKGYGALYKNLLAYIKENNHRSITQKEIIDQFSIK
jgi:hypothetical protein